MDVIAWLLEPDNPSVRYRTLVELLEENISEEERQTLKGQIAESEPVKKMFETMHPDGYWLQKNYKNIVTGDDVEYGSFGTTHFCLSYLAELGLDKAHPLVEKAALRYLGLQKEDGDWYLHLSCLYAYNIRTFIQLGYREDESVQRALSLMLKTERKDGGYLCDLHEKPNRRLEKSCIRGSVKALLAFAELPEYWQHERCLQLVDYFLNRHGIFRSNNHEEFVNKDMTLNSFPITWGTNIYEVLYALSKMGYGKDARLGCAWEELERRKDSEGRFTLDSTPAQCAWKVGKKGEPNKWITLYALLAKKHRDG